MQIKYLHKKLRYVSNSIDETECSQAVFEKLKKIQHFQKLKSENCDEVVIFNVLEIPRSTLYRWKSKYLIGLENKSRAPVRRRQREVTKEKERIY